MEIRLFYTAIILFYVSIAQAQKPREVSVGPGKVPSKVFPFRDRYRFNSFQTGYLLTFEGKRSKPLILNFEVLSGLPQFISEKGDTLFLDKKMAEYIQIGSTTFLNDPSKGYYEIVVNSDPIKIGISREWKLDRVNPQIIDHADGKSSIKISSREESNLIYSPEQGRMVRNEVTIYRMDSNYYFIKPKENIYKVNKRNAIKLFPKHERDIDSYLEKESIDLGKVDDIKKLLAFCFQLK